MQTPSDSARAAFRHVWVIAEEREGELKEVTFELLGAARRLAAARGCEAWCILLGHDVRRFAAACFERQADVVLVVDDPELARFADETHGNLLHRLVQAYKPEIVLCGATARGRALIPRVAVQACAGLTADCTGLEIDPQSGCLLQTRPAFGGNIMATIKTMNHRPQMATVRPRVMAAPEPQPGRTGRLIEEPLRPAEIDRRMRVLEVVTDTRETVKLADAEFIVTGGRAMGGPEGFRMLREFADLVDGAVGASRAAVDAGWIDYAHQVGQTGTTVHPHVYMACGVSGQIQHLVGMQTSDVIIAINRDPSAPIMQLADYAMVGDVFEVVPALMRELRRV